jgi:putative ABC transport system substrate-binding protein
MNRRELIALLGTTAAAWPLGVRAQQAGKLPTIGFMGTSTPAAWAEWLAAFQNRLRELGWIEGRTINIEYRWAESRDERFTQIAAEFTRLNVDVIVTAGAGIIAAKRVTSTIPIVFALSNDPVGSGLVASLARPGGNITGLSTQLADLPGKRLQLARELVAALRRLGLMFNLGVRDAGDIEHSIVAFARRPNSGLIVTGSPLALSHRDLIVTLAAEHKLPAVYYDRFFITAGGLISYGPDILDQYRRAAGYVDRILRGEKPADLPVQAPTKYQLVINLKTAKALGLDVPPTLLARADEVIE